MSRRYSADCSQHGAELMDHQALILERGWDFIVDAEERGYDRNYCYEIGHVMDALGNEHLALVEDWEDYNAGCNAGR